LPGTLGDALEALEQDDTIRNALGDRAYQVFCRAKLAEWDEYRIQVTDWERERYLHML
jgi:glutamine synthetase